MVILLDPAIAVVSSPPQTLPVALQSLPVETEIQLETLFATPPSWNRNTYHIPTFCRSSSACITLNQSHVSLLNFKIKPRCPKSKLDSGFGIIRKILGKPVLNCGLLSMNPCNFHPYSPAGLRLFLFEIQLCNMFLSHLSLHPSCRALRVLLSIERQHSVDASMNLGIDCTGVMLDISSPAAQGHWQQAINTPSNKSPKGEERGRDNCRLPSSST